MKKKALIIVSTVIVLALLATASVTVAWLTAKSSTVTNTFTVGKIEIELKEHEYSNGVLIPSKEVDSNDTYKVVPGSTEKKDPFVRVKSVSEKCFVYAKVINNLVIDKNEVAKCNISSDWKLIGESKDAETGVTTYLYRYSKVVYAQSNDFVTAPVFNSVTYDGEAITMENINTLKDKTIVINAYAHQSANIGVDSSVADTAALEWSGVDSVTDYVAISNSNE